MSRKLSEAQAHTAVILGVPLVVTVGSLAAYRIGGYPLAAVVVPALTAALLVLAWIFRPRWWGSTRTQVKSLITFASLATLVLMDAWWLPIVERLLYGLHQAFPAVFPAGLQLNPLSFEHKAVALAIVSVTIILLNFIWFRRQILPAAEARPSETDPPFPETRGYLELRDEFCRYMLRQLDNYDIDLHWSDSDYATLEAEVEMDRRGARRPRLARDLVAAIRDDHSTRAFLLLGDPGSGKSVSLRRLARELYELVPQTGIVPVYVNLREWDGPDEPDDADISRFVKSSLKRSAGRAGTRFLNEWYEQMLSHGRFFFVLDSFDEMPSVLDCDDATPRIKTISRAFDRFFHDIHNCRGVLASRRFRQPRGFRGRRLSIRPFSERQIRQAMSRWLLGHPLDAGQLVRELFATRPELVPAIRNPFLADLITQYMVRHDGGLPPNQYAIYEDHIRHRLEDEKDELREMGFSPSRVIEAATDIAWAMYQAPDVGLEVDTWHLGQLVRVDYLDQLVQALRTTRIARLGGVRSQRFSFVHRRFAEFFVVRSIIGDDRPVPFEAIPEDSRWRDCLVVYCGVAPEAEAARIADFCWRIIRRDEHLLEGDDVGLARPFVHCLRFLRDAFVSRPDSLRSFRGGLSLKLLDWLKAQEIIVSKIAAEAIGLAYPSVRSKAIAAAFERGIPWVSQTTFQASRHLGAVEDSAKAVIRRYLRRLPTPELIRSFKDLRFSLSLSENLVDQRRYLGMDVLSLGPLWLATLIAVSIMPWLLAVFLAIVVIWLESLIWRDEGDPKKVIGRPGLDTSLRWVMFGFGILVFFEARDEAPLESYGGLLIAMLCIQWWDIALMRRPTPSDLRLTRWLVGTLAAFGGAVVGGYFLLERLDLLWIGWTLYGLAMIVGMAGLLGFLWKTARTGFGLMGDLRELRRLHLSETVTRERVYRICDGLRTAWGRRRFLESLRVTGVGLAAESGVVTEAPWATGGVAEALARLEAFWNGLDE